jgi:hypothetical protein
MLTRYPFKALFKVETYEKDGVTKLSLSVIADHVLALRQPGEKADAGKPARQGTPFDDAVPVFRPILFAARMSSVSEAPGLASSQSPSFCRFTPSLN